MGGHFPCSPKGGSASAWVEPRLALELLVGIIFLMLFEELRVKVTLLFYIPSIGVDFSLCICKLVGPWSEHLSNDKRALPWMGEFVAALVALSKS